jgi:hypothetical protein
VKIFWVAFVLSILLCIFVIYQINNFGGKDYFLIFIFFYSSLYAILEILKWPYGKRKIDNTTGFAKYIYGEAAESYWERPYFSPRESIINIRGKGTSNVWVSFICSLGFIALSLCWLFIVP